MMNQEIVWLEFTGLHVTPWKLIGYTGALLFGSRWLVQFIASRRAGRPVIPRLFWYMSILGSFMTLSYFLFSAKQDSVGVLQNLFPAFTACYSLWLDIRHRGWNRDRAGHGEMPPAPGTGARNGRP
ncbi:MAG: membrane protein [Silanimonas sp.]|nr:MAG: membrane protein [Silanimonas sp.]